MDYSVSKLDTSIFSSPRGGEARERASEGARAKITLQVLAACSDFLARGDFQARSYARSPY